MDWYKVLLIIIFQCLISELVERLVLTERIESVIPLTYLALIAMAYFSPNTEIILRYKLTLWQHVEIPDISGFLQNLGLLFGIDFLSFLINGFILWEICRINVIKVLQKLLTPKGFAFSKSMDRTQMQFGETFSILAKNNQRLKRQMQKI